MGCYKRGEDVIKAALYCGQGGSWVRGKKGSKIGGGNNARGQTESVFIMVCHVCVSLF